MPSYRLNRLNELKILTDKTTKSAIERQNIAQIYVSPSDSRNRRTVHLVDNRFIDDAISVL